MGGLNPGLRCTHRGRCPGVATSAPVDLLAVQLAGRDAGRAQSGLEAGQHCGGAAREHGQWSGRQLANPSVTTPAPPGSGRVHRVPPVVWFFLLTYALSWGWLLPIAVSGGVVVAGRGWPTHFPALLGPLFAACAVTIWHDGRRGLVDLVRRMSRLRARARWWLFAVSPLVILVMVLIIDAATGRPLPAYGGFAVFSGLPSRWGVLGVAAGVLLVNGFGEETGWRGYALPALQRHRSPLVATIIVSGFWAVWHGPMFVVVNTFRSFNLPILSGWIIGLMSGAIVLTWLYNRSGGCILLVAVWHATYNLISGTAAAQGLLAAASTTLVIALALTLVVLEIRAIRAGRRSVLGPATEI